jgi:hypothetical protein
MTDMDSSEDDLQEGQAKASLKPKLNPEFMQVLKEAITVCGWSCDLVETASFWEWCSDVAGIEKTRIEVP